jgi:hypothetical protein
MPTAHRHRGQLKLSVPSPSRGRSDGRGVPSAHKHIAQFAHREGIRYSMPGRSPDSRTPLAHEPSSHTDRRSDFKVRLRFAYRCGGSPGIQRQLKRLHRIPVSLANPMQLVPST